MADTDDIVGQRIPPTDPAQIRRYARMHDPFNHPTVVYRRAPSWRRAATVTFR